MHSFTFSEYILESSPVIMVRVAPSLNGLVLLFGLIWFSVKWAEASIGLVRFGFSYTMGWFGMV